MQNTKTRYPFNVFDYIVTAHPLLPAHLISHVTGELLPDRSMERKCGTSHKHEATENHSPPILREEIVRAKANLESVPGSTELYCLVLQT